MASSREQMANRIEAWLAERDEKFYDIIQQLRPRDDGGPGFARAITFGIRPLGIDGTLVIWKENHLDFTSSDVLDDSWVKLSSEQEFYDFCAEAFGVK